MTLSIASNMRGKAMSMVPHLSPANFNKQTKSMLFFSNKLRTTHNAFTSDFAARLKYDVM